MRYNTISVYSGRLNPPPAAETPSVGRQYQGSTELNGWKSRIAFLLWYYHQARVFGTFSESTTMTDTYRFGYPVTCT